MIDVYLYPGEPNPMDVRLSDPTQLRGGEPAPPLEVERRRTRTHGHVRRRR